jgi:hypothetical protein
MNVTIARATLALAIVAGGAGAALADRIKNPTAVFSGLDKITGRTVSFEVATGETVQFGSLQMTPRVCYTRPPTESPNTTTFVEVDEVALDNKYRRVFTGWMFAASPGLHGIEHPVYDIWLVDCKGGTEVIAEPKEVAQEPPIEPARPRSGGPPQTPPQPGQAAQQQAPGNVVAPLQEAPQGGQVDVAPPRGVPTQPRQEPRQRFFPTGPVINNNRTND